MPESIAPRTSEKLWSEIVGAAQADEQPLPQRDIAYEWSNGRKFLEGNGVYEVPQVPGA